jgi:lipopolysaccharide export LptBFGC system permease protein LptF
MSMQQLVTHFMLMNLTLIFRHSDKSSLAELSIRTGTTISILLMSLIAVPISLQVGRRQNGFVFILPPLIYGLYNQIIFTINDYILDSTHHPLVVMLTGQIIHMLMFGIIMLYTYIKSFPKGQLFSKNK